MPLFLLLVAVPIVEIALFIEIGGWIGLWPTIGTVVLTAALGAVLLRAQGLAALAEVQGALREGGNPAPALAHGALILVAGVLLLTPGFFTDAVGFLLLVPPVRAMVIGYLSRRMTVIHASGAYPGDPGPGTVEGDYEEVDPEAAGDSGGSAGKDPGSGRARVPHRRPGD